jgi:hypothetical protein
VANGSSIATYGWLTLTLDLGLRRNFSWRFFVAEVTKPIIGVDFLSHFKLLVDSHHCRLVDDITELFTCFTRCENFPQPVSGIKVASPESIHPILREFPDLLKPAGLPREVKHSTLHHIRTTSGPPVNRRPRRLDPARRKIAQTEFNAMIDNGTTRRFESPWSSALHMVPKKDFG